MVAVVVADGGVKTWSRRHGHMTSPQTVATLRRGESRDHSTVMAGAGGGVSVSVAVAVAGCCVGFGASGDGGGGWRCEDEDAETQPHEKMLGTQKARSLMSVTEG